MLVKLKLSFDMEKLKNIRYICTHFNHTSYTEDILSLGK